MTRSVDAQWAELLRELRLLRQLVERQNEVLAMLPQSQLRMEDDISRRSFG